MENKKKYRVLVISLIVLLSLLSWSRYISTKGMIVREYKVVNENLPTNFHGLKIIHISDIHYGRTINKSELNHLVKEINILKPDIVVFTGDLIDKDTLLTTEIKKDIIGSLKKISTHYGKYAISGNHDFQFPAYKEILEKSNFIDLDNTYDIIYNDHYEPLFIGGLESEIDGKPDIENIISYFQIDKQDDDDQADNENIEYKILLMHTPDTFDEIKKYGFDLVLAGHSHNGQIRLPLIGPILTFEGAKSYHEPYYKIDDTDFFISGGLGVSGINFRLFNRPSFNLYRLTKK